MVQVMVVETVVLVQEVEMGEVIILFIGIVVGLGILFYVCEKIDKIIHKK